MGCLKLSENPFDTPFMGVCKRHDDLQIVEKDAGGLQGQYAEEDPETGWNSFDLRMYDPIIARWISPDPYRQFYSPYLAMGNNPRHVDPDGGFSIPDLSFLNDIPTFLEGVTVTASRLYSAGEIVGAAANVGSGFGDALNAAGEVQGMGSMDSFKSPVDGVSSGNYGNNFGERVRNSDLWLDLGSDLLFGDNDPNKISVSIGDNPVSWFFTGGASSIAVLNRGEVALTFFHRLSNGALRAKSGVSSVTAVGVKGTETAVSTSKIISASEIKGAEFLIVTGKATGNGTKLQTWIIHEPKNALSIKERFIRSVFKILELLE